AAASGRARRARRAAEAARSAAGSVALHAARIGGRLEQSVLACDGADAAERPRSGDLDVVAAVRQRARDGVAEARLELDLPRLRVAGVEGAREVVRVEARRVDRLLQVEAEVDVPEEEVERPLVLLVSARCPERDVGISA